MFHKPASSRSTGDETAPTASEDAALPLPFQGDSLAMHFILEEVVQHHEHISGAVITATGESSRELQLPGRDLNSCGDVSTLARTASAAP